MAGAQMLLLAAQIFEAPIAVQVIAAAALPLWGLSYPRLLRPFGGPAWLPALQGTAMCVPLWSLLSESLPLVDYQVHIACWAGFMLLGLFATGCSLYACRVAKSARIAAALEAGVEQIFRDLGRKGAILCRSGEAGVAVEAVADAGRSDQAVSSAFLAASLEAFEAQVRFERLDQAFLQGRPEWLQNLRDGRHSFDLVAHSASTLLAAVRTPPNSVLVVAALKASGPAARRVPAPVWAMIMRAVGGSYPLEELLQPVTEEFARGSPGRQLFRAQAAIKWCLAAQRKLAQRKFRCLMESGPNGTGNDAGDTGAGIRSDVSAALEHEVAMFQRGMPQLYGRGCACGRSLKPADNWCAFSSRVHNKCCKLCDAGVGGGGRHSGDCDRRARRDGTGALWSLSKIASHFASPPGGDPE